MRDLFLKFVKTIKDFEIGTMFSKFSLLFKLKNKLKFVVSHLDFLCLAEQRHSLDAIILTLAIRVFSI